MRLVLALLFVSCSAAAQNTEIQKQIIQRDQQSADFALQLRQSQEALHASPASRAGVESRQITERQRLENLNAQHRLEIQRRTPPVLRPQERQRMAAERRPFTSPIVEVPVRVAPAPPPLQPSLKGSVEVIEAPR